MPQATNGSRDDDLAASAGRLAGEGCASWRSRRYVRHRGDALRAEAAVLADRPDADGHLARAAMSMAGNPIATALVTRAEALLTDDQDTLVATAAGFKAANCHYQWARTLTLTSGPHQTTGQAALTALGTRRLQQRAGTEVRTHFP